MGKTYFISDLHLGASYIDDARAHERRAVDFIETIAPDADELILLGDVLDYWFEYRTVAPRGFTRFFGALGRLADRGVKITWFIGNHDIWLFDYLRDEIGMTVIDGVQQRPIYGHKFLLSHGDGVGHLPPSFRLMRAIFRNRVCQKLYASVHPRWTIPFAHAWSKHSRDFEHYEPEFKPESSGEPLVNFCREYLRDTDPTVEYFVFGHRHVLVDYPLGIGHSRMIILGDWIRHFSYGVFDGSTFSLNLFHGR